MSTKQLRWQANMPYGLWECGPRKWDTSIQCEYISTKNNVQLYAHSQLCDLLSEQHQICFAGAHISGGGGLHTRFKVYINIFAPDIQSDYAFAFYCRFLQVCMQKKENEENERLLKTCLQIWHTFEGIQGASWYQIWLKCKQNWQSYS